jgi:hypothetical protein
MGNIGGQASGDFRLGQGALRILYSLIKDTIPSLAGDAFLQSNPSAVVVPAARSTTLSATVKKGVLGGSVAFTRPDVGQNIVGGAFLVGGTVYTPRTRPLGLFINDAGGNSYENTPAVASGKGPFLRGGSVGVKIYETQVQTVLPLVPGGAAGVIGDPLTYNVGDKLYASVNGLLTNRWADSFEAQWLTTAAMGSLAAGATQEPDVTRMGTVIAPPEVSGSAEMFITLAFIG